VIEHIPTQQRLEEELRRELSMMNEAPATTSEVAMEDKALLEVEEWIKEECRRQGKSPTELFGKVIRQAIDEVVDGPRTGRWSITQLSKTEKTFVGTKVEIIILAALNLKRGKLDTEIEGHSVDVKWSMYLQWEIPTEAVDHICLVLGTDKQGSKFSVGVVRCTEDRLNKGKNKDSKRTLSKAGKCYIRWIVRSADLEPNFIASLEPEIRDDIMLQETARERVRRFLHHMKGKAFPRSALDTVIHEVNDAWMTVPEEEIEDYLDNINLSD
jgi:hypothetical protein